MTDEENEDGLTEQDRRDIAQLNAELGSYEFPIRVPIFVPNSFGTPAMEVGIGVFENQDKLVIEFMDNAPGKAVRRIMRKDVVLGLQFVMLELKEVSNGGDQESSSEGPADPGTAEEA